MQISPPARQSVSGSACLPLGRRFAPAQPGAPLCCLGSTAAPGCGLRLRLSVARVLPLAARQGRAGREMTSVGGFCGACPCRCGARDQHRLWWQWFKTNPSCYRACQAKPDTGFVGQTPRGDNTTVSGTPARLAAQLPTGMAGTAAPPSDFPGLQRLPHLIDALGDVVMNGPRQRPRIARPHRGQRLAMPVR